MTKEITQVLEEFANETWLPSLSKDEVKSLIDYTAEAYLSINEYLRGSTTKISQKNLNDINNISSAIKKFNYQNSITVYRAMTPEEYGYVINNNKTTVFLDFKSTSLSLEATLDFSELIADEWHYIAKFNISAAAHGAYIAPLSQYPTEFEYLLDYKQIYRILKNAYDPERKIVLLEIEV